MVVEEDAHAFVQIGQNGGPFRLRIGGFIKRLSTEC